MNVKKGVKGKQIWHGKQSKSNVCKFYIKWNIINKRVVNFVFIVQKTRDS